MFPQLPDTGLDDSLRDGVDALVDGTDAADATDISDTLDTAAEPPTIVSISDIHGYLDTARSALLTLADYRDFPPIVVESDDGQLHWADENYVLVFNGDLVDRGPANEGVLELVGRLIDEAPPGRIRVILGNHEALMLSRGQFESFDWYSVGVDDESRRRLCEAIVDGHVVAAYAGHSVTYVHAGAVEPYDVRRVNDSLVAAAEDLLAAIGTENDTAVQDRITTDYAEVLRVGADYVKGPDSGLVWLHFDHLSADAPPQVVGHTRHDAPTTKGRVHCQNVLRNSIEGRGGEAVFIETPEGISALVRQPDGGVDIRTAPF